LPISGRPESGACRSNLGASCGGDCFASLAMTTKRSR
jgi:hypothetical protein